MNLLTPIHVVAASQLYWMLLLACGYIIFQAIFRLSGRPVPRFWTKSYFLGKIALSFATINIVFLVWMAIGYLFVLPPIFLGISFVMTVAFSILYAALYLREEIITGLGNTIRAAVNLRLFSWVAAALAILILDFVLNVLYGANLAGDGLIHIANVRDLAENGFRFIDPAYGVTDATYPFIVWHVLMAIPSYLGIDAISIWLYSLPIAKLAIVASLSFLLQQILRYMAVSRNYIRTWVHLGALLFLLVPSTANSFLASYPNKLVIVWIATLIAGIFLLINLKKDKQGDAYLLIIVSSLLIATTHPLYSVFMFLLMAVIGGIFVLFGRRNITKQMTVTWLGSLFILGVVPLLSALLTRGGRSAELLTIEDYHHWELFGIHAFAPTSYGVLSPMADTLLYIIGFVGFISLLWLIKGRANKLLVGVIVIFPLIFTTIPPIFAAVNGVLPVWAIHRLFGVNVLVYIVPLLAIVGVATILHRFRPSLSVVTITAFTMAGIVVYLFISHDIVNVAVNRDYVLSDNPKKAQQYTQIKRYQTIMDTVSAVNKASPGSVIVAQVDESPRVAAAAPVRIFAMPIGHTSGLVLDIDQRIRCSEKIFDRANSANDVAGYLGQIKASYIMLTRSSQLDKKLGESERFTRLTSPAQKYQLYKLKKQAQLSVQLSQTAVCDL